LFTRCWIGLQSRKPVRRPLHAKCNTECRIHSGWFRQLPVGRLELRTISD
jgi:hypothetical protein